MNRRVLVVGLLVVLPLVGLLVANLGRDPHNVRSPLIGKPAPPFALPDLEGRPFTLEALRGRTVVLNFWASWCMPCLQEHPVLTGAASALGDRVQFLGVVYEDEISNIRSFLRQEGSTYPSLVDEGGKTAIAYGVYGVPETFIIDPQGTITAKHVGPMTPSLLRGYLEQASASASAGAAP